MIYPKKYVILGKISTSQKNYITLHSILNTQLTVLISWKAGYWLKLECHGCHQIQPRQCKVILGDHDVASLMGCDDSSLHIHLHLHLHPSVCKDEIPTFWKQSITSCFDGHLRKYFIPYFHWVGQTNILCIINFFVVEYSTVQDSTYRAVQYSAVQYSAVQYSAVQYSAVQYSALQYSTVQYSTKHLQCEVCCDNCDIESWAINFIVLYCTYCTYCMYWTVLYILHCTVHDCIILYCTVRHHTVQYFTVQYGSVLYFIVLHFAVLYCTILGETKENSPLAGLANFGTKFEPLARH